jgi:hypothetical protein
MISSNEVVKVVCLSNYRGAQEPNLNSVGPQYPLIRPG